MPSLWRNYAKRREVYVMASKSRHISATTPKWRHINVITLHVAHQSSTVQLNAYTLEAVIVKPSFLHQLR